MSGILVSYEDIKLYASACKLSKDFENGKYVIILSNFAKFKMIYVISGSYTLAKIW